MGTNYYLIDKDKLIKIEEVNKEIKLLNQRYDDLCPDHPQTPLLNLRNVSIHIGKISVGRKFIFNSSNINSLESLRDLYFSNMNYLIFDEYRRRVGLGELIEKINKTKNLNGDDYEKTSDGYSCMSGDWE